MKTFQKILILTVCLLPLLLLGERQSRRPITPEDIVNIRDISDSQISPDGKWIAFIDASATSTKDIWVMKSSGSGVKRLTNMNPEVNSLSLSFGSQESVQWRSKDGTQIEGVLIKPVNYEKGKKYPLIVQIHGGPRWAWWNG